MVRNTKARVCLWDPGRSNNVESLCLPTGNLCSMDEELELVMEKAPSPRGKLVFTHCNFHFKCWSA